MKMTTVQEYIWKLLKTYRCLRDDQIDRLVCMKMKGYKLRFACRQRERMLGLCGHQICRLLPGYTGMLAATPDLDLIAAMDMLLQFQKQDIEAFRPGTPPFKLVFVKNGQDGLLRAYYVAVVHRGAEVSVAQKAQSVHKGRHMNVVLFLLEDIDQADAIDFPFAHFYVVRGEGGFRFFEGGGDR